MTAQVLAYRDAHGFERWLGVVFGYTGAAVLSQAHWSEAYARRWADRELARLTAQDNALHGETID